MTCFKWRQATYIDGDEITFSFTCSQGSVVVYYKIDLDMAVTSESLKQQLKKYVEDHDGYSHILQIDPESIGFEGTKDDNTKKCKHSM